MNILLLNSMEDFNFISPSNKKLESPRFPPLGLLYIASSLIDEGNKVKIIDLIVEKNPIPEILKNLKDVDLVGISTNSFTNKVSASVAKLIKETDPSIKVVIGGPHCTFFPRQSLVDIPYADISVEGDGERTVKYLVNALNGYGKLSDIPGVYYRIKNKINAGKPAEIISNLDKISFPARFLVEKNEYGKVGNSFFFRPKITSMATTRGCPFRCRFCSRNDYFKNFRQRSAENVVKEIIEINDKYKTVIITDENFLTDTKRADKIFDKLIQQGTKIDLAIEGTRVDTAEKGLYKKMKRAGVKFIAFGIESGNQDVLDYYNKKITLDQIRKAVKLANKMNFTCVGNFIFGAPIETQKHIEQTIKFARSLPLDIAFFYPLSYMWGSDMWHEAIKNGKISETEGYFVHADSTRELGNFTFEQLKTFCKKAEKEFFYNPHYIFRRLIKTIKTLNFRLLKIQLNSI